MFSTRQKREISAKVQQILRETNHPELPEGEIRFHLRVIGKFAWSWADIQNNGAVTEPSINPHNEKLDPANPDHYNFVSLQGKASLKGAAHGKGEPQKEATEGLPGE